MEASRQRRGEALWCIEHFDLFEHLSPLQRIKLLRLVKLVQYRRGETIYLPGDKGDTVYFLRKGRVKLAYLDQSGKRLTLMIRQHGELFGETALIGEEERRLIAEALENAEMCTISKYDLLKFAEGDLKLSLRISKLVGRRLLEIENRLEDLLFKDVPTRLARLLCKLAAQYGTPDDGVIEIRLRITHQDLADLIGSTRETTSATLGGFERSGLIEKGRSKILIKDLEALRAKAGL